VPNKNKKLNMYSLQNKVALVGGASQGLGAASAHALAAAGATVIVFARTEEKLKAVVKSLPTPLAQTHQYLLIDTTNLSASKKTFTQWVEKIKTVHILVNNTGGPAAGLLHETSIEDLKASFESHLLHAHQLVQLLLPGMREAKFGRIINLLSVSIKEPIDDLGISNTIRAAMANWAKTLSRELGPWGITVNNVLPGFTNTERLDYLFSNRASKLGVSKEEITKGVENSIPVKRLGEPKELAAAVCFLCSVEANFINGINLPVDGGQIRSL
jgi:3-oxoacyl-[acyl-carrier protein] reductase